MFNKEISNLKNALALSFNTGVNLQDIKKYISFSINAYHKAISKIFPLKYFSGLLCTNWDSNTS